MEIGIDPRVLEFGTFAVRWSGLLAAVGLVLGYLATRRTALAAGCSAPRIDTAACWIIPVGVVAARLVNVLENWSFYLTKPDALASLHLNDLALWGGIVGGSLAGRAAVRGRDRALLADALVPGLVLGIVVGRIGQFLDGSGQGLPSGLPWATFYASPLAATPDVGVSRHPAQLYDALGAALAGIACAALAARLPRGGGFWLFVTLYGLVRVGLGSVRLDPPFVFGWSLDQLLAATSAVLGLAVLMWHGFRVLAHAATYRDAAARELVLTLYGRPDCHLCDDARAELRLLEPRYPHRLRLVDVSRDPDLFERYHSRVPVLAIEGREFDAPLDTVTLERALGGGA